jgi:xylan 1,4-beta-xylosidase
VITNPILPGFHPDPSIVRDGEDYWIATSTFEWLPGIRLHHSRDLVHWRPAGHALTRPSQIDLRGVAPSKGVWAPNLSVDHGVWYLCYSLVRNITDNYFDVDNFLITAPAAQGPWSDPTYLNSSGFDPALFHAADGRKWLVNLEWDFRPGHEHPGAIVLQEFSPAHRRLVGEPTPIYRGGSDLGCVEGPLLFQRGEYHYLLAAEGGTGYGHGVTMARSHSVFGPWEPDPANPIVTSAAARFQARGNPEYLKPDKFNPASVLQKSGHGSPVETPGGEVYLAHLCSRPALPQLRCVLGRETALQKMVWTSGGWLRLAAGGNLAQVAVPEPALPSSPWPAEAERDDFDGALSAHWASPRCFVDDTWVSLARPGWVGLRGRESLFSPFQPSVLARRLQHLDFTAETRLAFDPRRFQETAGLVCLYDTMNFVYLRLGWSDELQTRVIEVTQADNGHRLEFPEARVVLQAPSPGSEPAAVRLRVQARDLKLNFSWAFDEGAWQAVGPGFDETKLSDEYCKTGEFTGAFVGLAAQDLSRRQAWAWFDWFAYRGESR